MSEDDSKKYRNFRFVHNNYKNTKLEDEITCRYIIYGKEIAPTTGTPHLQGTICFKNGVSLKSIRNKMPGCDVRVCDYLDESIEYCKKDNMFTERGDKPMSQKERGVKGKEYWDDVLLKIKEGREEELDSHIQVSHARTIDYIQQKQSRKRKLNVMNYSDEDTPHIWYYGPTGSGKSKKVWEDHPDHYIKLTNKWWDGYNYESVVHIEELDKENGKYLCSNIKKWADRYPFLAEVKNGTIKARPEKIIVTSNYHPNEIWSNYNDINPILRRFKIIKVDKPITQDDIEEEMQKISKEQCDEIDYRDINETTKYHDNGQPIYSEENEKARKKRKFVEMEYSDKNTNE